MFQLDFFWPSLIGRKMEILSLIYQDIQARLILILREPLIHRGTSQGVMIMAPSRRAPFPFIIVRL